MSFYNMLFGENSISEVLLNMLGLLKSDVPRYRDCYVGDEKIVIYTRTGGGNRDYYENLESCKRYYPEYINDGYTGPWNDDLRKHSCYLSDEDGEEDPTYAYFYFKFPDEHEQFLQTLPESLRPSEKFKMLMEKLGENKHK